MDNRQPPEQRGVEQEESAAFTGNLGKTQTIHLHVAMADGSIRSVEVYRVVNVGTNPELRERALTGEIHRLEDGQQLALPFVYHDPQARKFALVIPLVLSHLELKERAKLLNELSEDSAHEVPRYVRECTTVTGTRALDTFLNEPPSSFDEGFSKLPPEQKEMHLKAMESDLAQTQRYVSEREQLVASMAERLSAQEEILRKREQQLDARQRDLVLREQRLEEWPAKPEKQSSSYRPAIVDGEWREVSSFPPKSAEAPSSVALSVVESTVERVVEDGEVVEVDSPKSSIREQIGKIDRVRLSGPPPLKLRPGISPPSLNRRGASFPPDASGDDRLTTVAPHPGENDVAPPPLPVSRSVRDDSTLVRDSEVMTVINPDVEPPSHFLSSEDRQIAMVLDQALWLFVRVEDVHIYSYRRSLELLIQYREYQRYPIVFLTLVTERKEEFWIRRAVLDPYRDSDRKIIEALAQSYSANVVLYVGSDYLQTLRITSQRETIAREVLERVEEQIENTQNNVSAADARELAFEEPPPVDTDDLPFISYRRKTPTAAAVAMLVEQLVLWIQPERIRQAVLTYSIPRHAIDASIKRLLTESIRFGLALPDELRDKAIKIGLAADHADLIDRQLKAFAASLEQGETDLDSDAIAANWRKLLDTADALDIAVDDAIRIVARRNRISSLPNVAAKRPLKSLSVEQLHDRLKQEEIDSELIRELTRRGDPALLPGIFDSFVHLQAEEIYRVMPYMVQYGNDVIDVLINALSSESVHVRQASALALGKLKPRRAMEPLIAQLQNEKTNIWSEFARSIGDYGNGILKSVVRALQTSEGTDQRFVVTLAHLVNNGCSHQVGKLEKDADPRIASAARKATAQYSRMKWEDQAIREGRPLNNATPPLRFSQIFFAELAKLEG
jgi:hypothetical protein